MNSISADAPGFLEEADGSSLQQTGAAALKPCRSDISPRKFNVDDSVYGLHGLKFPGNQSQAQFSLVAIVGIQIIRRSWFRRYYLKGVVLYTSKFQDIRLRIGA